MSEGYHRQTIGRLRKSRCDGWIGFIQLVGVLCVAVAPARADLDADVEQLIRGAGLEQTRVAVLVTDLRTGRTLVDLDADQPMVPASNMKLLTTAAALHRLGPDFHFTTRLALMAPGSDGRHSGVGSGVGSGPAAEPPSLLVLGGGDPAFGDPVLLAQAGLEVEDLLTLWTDAVVATGHTRFRRLLLDDRVFDHDRVHPDWPVNQLHRFSFAQVAGLNFHENLLAVLPVPAENDGQAPLIQLYPYFPQLRTLNRATTSNVDAFQVQRPPNSNRFTFMGSVRNRRSQPYRVTVDDPPLFFAEYLRHKLAQAGVTVDRIERVPYDARLDPARLEVLHEINTTLAGVLDRTNQDSQNLFAEALFKRLGREQTGAPGSFQNGAAAVRLFLRDKLASRIGLSGVRVADGSGLSKNNRATARVLVQVLELMHDDRELGPVFVASLAHAGHTGTLRQRLRDLDGEVYGKSGWLGASADYASSLAGYLVAPSGRRYAFALVFNGFRPPITHNQVKALQDDILRAVDAEVAGR
ncbi:MAG: D-alanyl-D-alanine carboxypeptidase/D-alanyl-D-alanine-endopeptidase [Planctomycetota bacterium]